MRTAVKSFIRKILRVSYCGSRFCADSSTLAANKFFEIKIIAQAIKNGERLLFTHRLLTLREGALRNLLYELFGLGWT
jgi:hypothetical protein